MNKGNYNFFILLKVLLTRLFSGRVHFSKKYVGKLISMEDGMKFQVIRDLKVDSKQSSEKSVAVFIVRFKFSGLPLGLNKLLSMFPAPFLMAKPGFRQKIWTINEDGYFQGIYEWASVEYAKTYPLSFIFKLMAKRSAEGTLSYEVIPDTHLADYIEHLT